MMAQIGYLDRDGRVGCREMCWAIQMRTLRGCRELNILWIEVLEKVSAKGSNNYCLKYL